MSFSEVRIENSGPRGQVKTGIKSFEDLIAWQRARELTLLIYEYTKQYPPEERYGLSPQMRRSTISVTSNIAEGFGRQQSKDKEHYYVMALGSLSELQSQIIISSDLGYMNSEQLKTARAKLTETRRLLSALLNAHRK